MWRLIPLEVNTSRSYHNINTGEGKEEIRGRGKGMFRAKIENSATE
jgi:hypothetical protein